MLSDILKDAGFRKILMAATGKEAVCRGKKRKTGSDHFGCDAAR